MNSGETSIFVSSKFLLISSLALGTCCKLLNYSFFTSNTVEKPLNKNRFQISTHVMYQFEYIDWFELNSVDHFACDGRDLVV